MFEYLGQQREAGDAFNQAMSDYSALASYAFLLSYDLSGVGTVVDVGGGHGKLLATILRMYPDLRGVLFDVPSVIEDARVRFKYEQCRERCLLVSGSFLESVPTGADAYLMSNVIHDWDDKHAVRILSNCRRSMKPDAKLVLIEFVLSGEKEVSFGNLLDLNMLVMNGGRERTESQFRELLDAAGLRITRIVPTLSALSVVEAGPK
jgi:SAM-dependent methyltransferase